MTGAHDHVAQEWRAALRYDTGTCPPGQHHMMADRCGGGVCPCGERVDREELE